MKRKRVSKNQRDVGRGTAAPQLQLTVDQRCIDAGVKKDARLCMIAQAVKRVFPKAQYVWCDTREIAFSDPVTQTRRRYFNTPIGARAAALFDQGSAELKPFVLRLNEGVMYPMGWHKKHPGSTRQQKTYRKTGRKAIRYKRHRAFGACVIDQNEREAALL